LNYKNMDFIHSIAVGMQSKEEVDCNVSIIENGRVPEKIVKDIRRKIEAGCGRLLCRLW